MVNLQGNAALKIHRKHLTLIQVYSTDYNISLNTTCFNDNKSIDCCFLWYIAVRYDIRLSPYDIISVLPYAKRISSREERYHIEDISPVRQERISLKKPPLPVDKGGFFMVEVRGIEPLSESNLEGLSPGAVCYLHSLTESGANTLHGLVASLCVVRAKLSARTDSTSITPEPGSWTFRGGWAPN